MRFISHMPLALAEAQAQGRFKDGDQLLLAGFGGGLSWGAAALKWWSGPTGKQSS